MSMTTILQKIELLMFNNLIGEDNIIDDDGAFNIPMEKDDNQRYSFTDDKEIGERTEIEQKKIVFLNDVMDIFSDLHQHIRENDLYENPIFFNKQALQSKVEAELSVNLDDGEDSNTDEKVDEDLEQITTDVIDMEL